MSEGGEKSAFLYTELGLKERGGKRERERRADDRIVLDRLLHVSLLLIPPLPFYSYNVFDSRFGVVVPTPYGNCRVLMYREEDQILVCQLPFGKPRARLYIPLAVPMQLEKAREEAERVAMERCEEELRGVYAWEKDMRKREYELMNAEEHTLRAHFRRVDEAAAEDAALEAAVQQGVEDARKFLLMPAGKKVSILAEQMKSR